MWPSKISSVGSPTRMAKDAVTRDLFQEELKNFAKSQLRDELELLRKDLNESFLQHLEVFRHELEAFFQTWAFELVKGRQSQKYSLTDALADMPGTRRTSASSTASAASSIRRSVGSTDSPLPSPRPSQKQRRRVSQSSNRLSVRNPRLSKDREGEEVVATPSLTSAWMNRHRRHSLNSTVDTQAAAATALPGHASDHLRRSNTWMARHHRSRNEQAGYVSPANSEEKRHSSTIGDIVAAIVKPKSAQHSWMKRHTESYRQLQLTQETVLRAVQPSTEYNHETSYSLMPTPNAEMQDQWVTLDQEERRRSSVGSKSSATIIPMGATLTGMTNMTNISDAVQEARNVRREEQRARESANSIATIASQDMGSNDITSSTFAAKSKFRRTFTWAGNDWEAYDNNVSGFGDIDDAMLDLKKSKNANAAKNSSEAPTGKPSLKRGFTMGSKRQGAATAEEGNMIRQTQRRGSDQAPDPGSTESSPGRAAAFQEGSGAGSDMGQMLMSVDQKGLRLSQDFMVAEVGEDQEGLDSDSELGDFRDFQDVNRIAELVYSPMVTYVVTMMILGNSLIAGFETDWKAQHWKTSSPAQYRICHYFFCIFFVSEIVSRIYVHGCGFFYMAGWRWNVFDFTVVMLQLSHQVLSCTTATEQEQYQNVEQLVPVLYMARLFRIFRAASMAHLFSELRMLIISIADSLKSICWAMVLLVLVMYVISVYFTQVVTVHKVLYGLADDSEEESLEYYYGSLGRTVLSLFQCISNGISWHEVMDPLIHFSPYMVIVFMFYITFTVFVVLNVITGIFVETATQKANEDKKKVLMLKLKEFFHHADTDGSGSMTWEKFERQLEIPEMKVYLKAIDLDQEEAWDLFQLLDMDDSNEIDVEEFVNGCLRLHGEAKALDLATFMYNYKEWTNLWTEHVDQLETTLASIEDHMAGQSLEMEKIHEKLFSKSPSLRVSKQNDDRGRVPCFTPDDSEASKEIFFPPR